ncbi:MAG: MFS transporter [Candidatus Muproteobacteria bacterium RIFCSPHIGHO2_01_60_12]|nr:MAG: MFS transporter [Candidatus Muproteobacteria bacterium RIFCSPHIGHO2_01_60_12]
MPRREIFAWAMYDFANSGYTTVVLTAVFNAYFVGVVAGNGADRSGTATLLWTVVMAITNVLVLASAPILGAIADHGAHKKRFLAFTTVGCVFFTILLGFVGRGDVALGMTLVILATLMFASGENFIAAFLPEIAEQKDMGRISGYGWSLGYLGGLLVLGMCLVYIQWAQSRGDAVTQYVPVTMWITAVMFALAALPTFIWLRERAVPQPLAPGENYIRIGFARVRHTLSQARHYRDLFRFLITLAVYYCGINTVVVLAAIYAQEVMGFSMQENIMLILVVNVTAAIGALTFGLVQDRLGSVRTLAITLLVWIAALAIAYFTETRAAFWVVANLVGVALGSSQSAGRALVGQFSPPERSAEFFGLWGLAGKLAAVIGPLVYGLVTYLTHGNHRQALLSTTAFFIAGLLLLLTVNERRGRAAAFIRVDSPASHHP